MVVAEYVCVPVVTGTPAKNSTFPKPATVVSAVAAIF
jgi:hypothetical protein